MKKIFMLLVAFAAMVFVSCSKDDDGENGGTTNKDGKRLVSKIIYNEVDSYDTDILEYNFTYDSEGNVSEVIESDTHRNETSRFVTTIKRDGNKVTMTELDLYYTWCTLDDAGRVVKEDNDNSVINFTYDNSGQLIKIITPNKDNFEYTWKQGNMTNSKHWHINSSGEKYDNSETVYEYTQHANNINIDFTGESWGSLYMDTYFGKTNKNLIKSISVSYKNNMDDNSIDEYEYEYEFDGDYVSTIKEYNTHNGGERKQTGTYHIYYK